MRMPQLLCVRLFYGLSHPLLSLYSILFSRDCDLKKKFSLRFFIFDFSECCDWLILSAPWWHSSCNLLLIFWPALPCPSYLYIHVCPPNHFAPVVFKGAVWVAGDKEVHLPRQEQPGGTSWNHQLHAHVSWVGFKTTARGIFFFLQTLRPALRRQSV